ncbi:PQQ-binding-like beta-propeller repeat protein [Candidatus Bathyarchaeota archaeon]|nr:PQQ-binding-like beta-propeller repeat protein [Candidatus Bathyarchaeota archaeon]NIV67265.1 PQQ-binding-like beta-propeller repeat protein [Candidatus Bathyarchaeota archaeon]NIW34168.1 PQQ-binding-like beta-propeller repeat protein [Candidatus Bathyarchaeota archaeon]
MNPKTLDDAPDAEWPMLSHDSSHTGFTGGKGPETNEVRWGRGSKTGYRVSSPVVANERVYVAWKGNLYCLDASDGSTLWKYEEVLSPPAVSNGRVYVSGEALYCLDATDGSLLWEHKPGSTVAPTVLNGRVFTVSGEYVHCLNALTGSPLWKYNVSGSVVSPAVWEERVYVSSDSLYCLNATDGSLLWTYKNFAYAQSPSRSAPTVSRGRVYVGTVSVGGTYAGYVYCLHASSGALLWKYKLANSVFSSPAVGYGRVYVACSSNDEPLYCFNASSGSLLWKRRDEGILSWNAPAIADEKVYMGAGTLVLCYDSTDGSLIWKYDTGHYGHSSPAIAYGHVYIGSGEDQELGGGYLYCFGEKGEWAKETLWIVIGSSVTGVGIATAIILYWKHRKSTST